MNQLMHNMKNIPGVVGVAIFKDDGTLASYDFPEAYDKTLLKMMGDKFQPIKEILPQEQGEIVYLCWEFEDILGFYYPVSGGWVNILSSDTIPMPVFSLTMTAVSNKLPQLLKETVSSQLPAGSAAPDREVPVEPPAVANAEIAVIPKEKINEMKSFFSNYLGPAAGVIFKRCAFRLGYHLEKVPGDKLMLLLDGIIEKVPENKKTEVTEKVKIFY